MVAIPDGQGYQYRKSMRLRNGADFQAVFSRRVSVSDKNLVLYAIPNGLDFSRLGLSISKKVTRTAPARNRWKRILREVFRLSHASFPQSLDLVFLVRTPAPEGFEIVREKVGKLLGRIAVRLNSTKKQNASTNDSIDAGSLPQRKNESREEETP